MRPQPSGCIHWEGLHDNNGYPTLHVKLEHQLRCSRLAWTAANGPIPDGLFVLHSCDNPGCVNVEHLRTGTQSDNMKDRKERGRYNTQPQGSANPRSFTSDEDVIEIRRLYAEGVSQCEIARRFGHFQPGIYRIVRGFTYKNVPGAFTDKVFGKGKHAPETLAEVRKLFAEGIRCEDITKQTGVCEASIYIHTKDLPRRKIGRKKRVA